MPQEAPQLVNSAPLNAKFVPQRQCAQVAQSATFSAEPLVPSAPLLALLATLQEQTVSHAKQATTSTELLAILAPR